jgi:hypothetical protein
MTSPDTIQPVDERRYQPGLFAAFRTRPKVVTQPVVLTQPGVAQPGVVAQPVAYAQPQVVTVKTDARAEAKAAKDAYERGRRDERTRHRSSPLLGFLLLIVAVIGGGMIYLAAREGSFAGGGQVVDKAVSQAVAPAKSVAGSAGDALENAGQTIKKNAGS